MTFAQPLFLFGALAAFIPLLVHLFDRRRPRPVPFGAIAFVLRSQRRTASRLRLKRLLLYVLRTLVFIALPVALARPQLVDAAVAPVSRGLSATAVIIDTSLAMRWRDGESLFDEAKDEARAALRGLSPEEPATLVACTRAPRPVAPTGFERAPLFSALDELTPGYGVVDMNRCLDVALQALADSPLPGRRLVVVSAFTQSSLRLELPPPEGVGPDGQRLQPEVVLRDVAARRGALPNHALVDARAVPAPQLGPRAWAFTFTVRNESDEAASDVELRLEVGGEVVTKGFVDVAAHGSSQKTLSYRFTQSGAVAVTGALAADALAEDDSRALVVTVPRPLRVLLVNGAPSTQKYRDEAWFTEAALSAPGSPVQAVVRDADAAWHEDFSAWDALFLLNVEAPSPEVERRLEAFVSAGGGLFVSMGPNVDADAWNASMGALLPRRLRVVKTAVEPQAPDADSRAARLQQTSTTHPVLQPFVGPAREGLSSVRFWRYVLFESDAAGGPPAEVLGTLDDGAPAFLAARHGEGRVFLYASSVGREWSDLPIRTGFLPLMQRVAAWLTGTLDERETVRARVGESLELRPTAGQAPAFARGPSGVEVPLAQGASPGVVSGGPLTEPGVWAVLDARGKPIDALAFAATLDPAASDLSRLDLEALRAWFGDAVVSATGSGPAREATPLWTWLIAAAVLALFFEGLLLRK